LKEEIIINIDPIEIMIEVQEGKKEDIIDQILVKDVIEDQDTPEVDHKIKRNIIKKKNIITDQNLETKKRKSIKTQKKNIKNIIVPLDIPVKKNKNLKKTQIKIIIMKTKIIITTPKMAITTIIITIINIPILKTDLKMQVI
jgi:hypothetical protein